MYTALKKKQNMTFLCNYQMFISFPFKIFSSKKYGQKYIYKG